MSDQVRRAMSYGSCAAHVQSPPPHTPYQIRNSETQNPEPAGPEHGAASREHGAVEAIYSISHTFPVDD